MPPWQNTVWALAPSHRVTSVSKRFSPDNLPTEVELREVIETTPYYVKKIVTDTADDPKIIYGECDEAVGSFGTIYPEDNYKDSFTAAFELNGIEYVTLNGEHVFMAVNTLDKGILLFDPTFAQFEFPPEPNRYIGKYFLDTPKNFMQFIAEKGGTTRKMQLRASEIVLHGDNGEINVTPTIAETHMGTIITGHGIPRATHKLKSICNI